MKWILPLYFIVLIFSQNTFAQNTFIKEDESPHYSLWRCEHFEIAHAAFTRVFQDELSDKKISKVYLTSYFIKHGKSGSGFTTCRIVSKEQQTLFFSASNQEVSIAKKSRLETNILTAFKLCFEKSLRDWKAFQPAKGFASFDDISGWITFPGSAYNFNDKVSRLVIIERLADKVPLDYISDHEITFLKSAHWGEHGKHHPQSNEESDIYEVDINAMIAAKEMAMGVKMLRVSAKMNKEKSSKPTIDATIIASNKACIALLKQFAVANNHEK